MRKPLGLAMGWLGCVAAMAMADPPPPVTPQQEFLAEQIATLEEEGKAGNLLPARTLEEIVRLELINGELRFKLLAKGVADEATIPLEGLRGVCRIQRLGDGIPIPDGMRISIHIIDIEHLKSISIELSNIGRTELDVTLSSPEVSMTTQFMAPVQGGLMLDEGVPRFHVQVINESGSTSSPAIQQSASSVPRLIDENHEQLVQSLGDALRLLKSMHLLSGMNEREVKQMLSSNVPVGADVQRQVDDAIRLMQDDPESGEKALQKLLESRGLAAASALSHAPRENWSADVTMRVDNLLAPVLLQNSDAALKVNNHPRRLIDLLYWPDESIRKASCDRLKELVSTNIDFDPKRDPYTQADSIEALRDQLPK